MIMRKKDDTCDYVISRMTIMTASTMTVMMTMIIMIMMEMGINMKLRIINIIMTIIVSKIIIARMVYSNEIQDIPLLHQLTHTTNQSDELLV